ncbi:Late Golgi vesicule protein, putative [Candida maltosa Xu316]|uniref:Late Golgi vesicule protein, putative n=1 Tax=Candida maltosa (strain Xu316) TaxID=1245528 RepID=M3JYE2_CANMX|nr:Late Golgi vesicule protein, putative [Candida maltosa Xu316]
MNLDTFNGQDLSGAFRITNLAVSGLCVLGGFSQLFHSHSFVSGLYIIAFGAVIGALEFRVPPEAYVYASFLFSFIGRGIYTFLGISLTGGSFFRIFAALIVFLIGLVYIVLETVPSISPPDNMNPDGAMIGLNDEETV